MDVMVGTATAWIVVAFVVVAALLLTAVIARAQGRRLERRMVAELGQRWYPPLPETVSVPPDDPRSSPAPVRADDDLQITLEDLLSQRDVLLEEFQTVQQQITLLKKRVQRRRPVAAVAGETDETVVLLHDVLPEEWAERRRR
jgi:hypothetical protein